ncbi:endothelial differentiation-related factor 1 isoform X1 [Ursus arctos]|uniref:endothelial differentiation-related factor 1 isoform X1 n=1 Tax=Ursus arctos TaxID=9644 RepID=UPI0025481FBB|nr:endothelial differentiation-related factor 1 isoform X1 [Ursus arctos]
MAESDWDTVTVLRKKGPTAAQAKSKQAILAAQRRGEDVETSKKWAAGQNKQHSITKNTAKLDRETEELHHDRVTLEVGKVIQQGRQSKGLTQKDLATVSMAGPFLPGCGRAGGRSVFRRRCRSAWGGFWVPLTLAFSGEAVSGQPSLPLECSVASFMHRPQSLRGLLRSKALGPRVVPACAACW